MAYILFDDELIRNLSAFITYFGSIWKVGGNVKNHLFCRKNEWFGNEPTTIHTTRRITGIFWTDRCTKNQWLLYFLFIWKEYPPTRIHESKVTIKRFLWRRNRTRFSIAWQSVFSKNQTQKMAEWRYWQNSLPKLGISGKWDSHDEGIRHFFKSSP